ncbi:MAG: hypothetical protein JOZ57_14000, partial [Abitibacteriaceae bacterium]|nr:hypothetical protein [Abditibacteriaceae bacterium]
SVRKIVTRANPAYAPVPNVPVTVGQVNNNGTGFTTLAQTTTDSLGGYTLTLPIGVGPSPSLVVRAGGPTGVTLENIVTGPIVDISPETTAAVQVLFAAAQARGIVLSQLRLGNITEYINRAVQVASIGTPSATTARAVTDAKDVIQFSKTTNAVLNTVLTNINAASTPIPTNTPRRTPGGRGTPTPKGGVPTPPGGGSTPTPGGGGGNPTPIGGGGTPTPIGGGGNPTPRPTTGPTSSPFPTTTPGRTPGGTPFPTSQPTPSATFFPTPIRTPGGTPGGTPITNPTPLPTTSTTPGGFPTPAPTISVTPRPLSRRGRH